MFPPIEPYTTEMLPVSDIHTIYIEQSGNPEGQPALFLHGGPGSRSKSFHRQYFDPERYRIIAFDQRGGGRSTPYAQHEQNTVQDLIDDIEKIRHHLGIDQRVIMSTSRGTALNLAYAAQHPHTIKAMVLNALYTHTTAEQDRIFQGGPQTLYPQQRQAFTDCIPPQHHNNIKHYCIQQLCDTPLAQRDNQLAEKLLLREYSLLKLTDEATPTKFDITDQKLQQLALNLHYQKSPFPDDFLETILPTIKHIPTAIIHGRYDTCTPTHTAYQLHQLRPQASFDISPNAAHRYHPDKAKRIIHYTNLFAQI